MFNTVSLRCARTGLTKVKFYSTTTSKPLETIVPEAVADTTKTPVLRQWMSYWKQLMNDYKDVIIDAGKHMKDHPVKSTIWLTLFTGAYTCSVLNPDEANFRAHIINKSNDLIFVGKSIRNPATVDHLRVIESYYNSDQIKRISFGIFSVILRDYKTRSSGVFKDNCSYTQPTYLEIIRDNIIDIGFLKKWWILEKKMLDYDVNDTE